MTKRHNGVLVYSRQEDVHHPHYGLKARVLLMKTLYIIDDSTVAASLQCLLTEPTLNYN